MKKSVPLLISAILLTADVLILLMLLSVVSSATALVDGIFGGIFGGVFTFINGMLGAYAMPYLLIVGSGMLLTWFAWAKHNKILVIGATTALGLACVLRFSLMFTILLPLGLNIFSIYTMNSE